MTRYVELLLYSHVDHIWSYMVVYGHVKSYTVHSCRCTTTHQYNHPFITLLLQVINFYMCMLKERDDALCLAHPPRRPSWFFNSFFIDKLLIADKKYTYANVKRWSKKFDVFAMEKIFMPVNLGNTHWTLLVVYIQRKEIHYYDSMSGPGKKYIEGVLRWLQDEAKDKKGTDNYDTSDWATFDREPFVPQQQNGVDCGVFTTVCADFVSDDLELMYSQGDMPFFREKICADILRGSLLYAV